MPMIPGFRRNRDRRVEFGRRQIFLSTREGGMIMEPCPRTVSRHAQSASQYRIILPLIIDRINLANQPTSSKRERPAQRATQATAIPSSHRLLGWDPLE